MNAREHGEVLGETGPYAALTRSVIHAGIEVQKRLGPWLLESAYEACLAYELERSGHTVERQVPVSLRYRDLIVPNAFRMDLLIDGILVVELKVTEAITKEHEAQVLSYLRFSEKPAGLLMNFALQPLAKRGVRRFLMTHSSSVMNEGGPPGRRAASSSPLALPHTVSGPCPDTMSERFLADEDATEALGEALARLTPPGGTWLLRGELGAGKTTWTRGFLKGLGGDPDQVASPTYAVLHRYEHPGGRLFHLDLLRTGPEGAWILGLEEQVGSEDRLVVEWAGGNAGPWPSDWVAGLSLRPEGEGRRADWTFPDQSRRP